MNPPANWYPDPTGRHGQRYWDGEQWTEHVFTDGVQGVDPLEAAAPADGAEGQDVQAQAGEGAHDETTDAATEHQGGASDTDDGGLFADAGQSADDDTVAGDAAGTAETPDDAGTWSPEQQAEAETSGEDGMDVAPEVEPGDVLGTLDEVADADTTVAGEDVVPSEDVGTTLGEDVDDVPVEEGAEAATAIAADDVPDTGTEEDDTPGDDFSDAFMVTPETVSRLVSRQASSQPQPADTTAANEPTESSGEETPEPAAEQPAPEPGVIDAPPPDTTAPAASQASTGGALGISGDLVGGAFAERDEDGPVALQNSRLLRCSLGEGPGVIARQGTMVAYQGDVDFERQGAGGVTRALKRAATGEGLAMMRAEGTGDVFFADGGQHVFLLHLDGGPGLSVNGRNVLAFSAALQWDIERVKGATLLAGGLFNTTLTGSGWVALVSDGEPVVLRTDEAPTYVDVNALVAWSGGLSTRITNTVTAKSLVGLGSGEAFQMAFDGAGIVIVQPSEGPMGGAAAT